MAAEQVVGILLAAGRGRRFDPTGQQDKLLARLSSGIPVAVAAATNLRAALDRVVAVVRPNADELATELHKAGCEVITCPHADEGMGSVLAFAIQHCADARGWLVALADMPFIAPQTYTLLIHALGEHALVAPEFDGQRGHPVGFAQRYLPQLLALKGDFGARKLISKSVLDKVPTTDNGILRDIDLHSDV